jgi:methylthioribose-1-phosphate isomerase
VSSLLSISSPAASKTAVSRPCGSPVASYAFDVTPARLVSGPITKRSGLQADRAALAGAFPERSRSM